MGCQESKNESLWDASCNLFLRLRKTRIFVPKMFVKMRVYGMKDESLC